MPSNTQDPVNIQLKQFVESQDYAGGIDFLMRSDIPLNLKYYNLGFFHYKNGELVKAKQFYELAKYHGMFSMELDKSIERINEELYINSAEDQYSPFENAIIAFNSLPDPQFYLLLSFLGAVCMLALFKRWIALAIVGITSLIVLAFFSYETSRLHFEYNAKEKVFHSGPSDIFEEVGVIPPGVKLFYSKSKYQWQYIEYPKVFRGWVKREVDGN